MSATKLLISIIILFISTSSHAASLHDIDMSWSKYNLSVISLFDNLDEMDRNENTTQNAKEIIREFRIKVEIISERIYDCYIICELVSLNDDKSEAFLRLSDEFLKLKKDDISKNIEYLAIQSSLNFKKNITISQMIDDYLKMALETTDSISRCNALKLPGYKPAT